MYIKISIKNINKHEKYQFSIIVAICLKYVKAKFIWPKRNRIMHPIFCVVMYSKHLFEVFWYRLFTSCRLYCKETSYRFFVVANGSCLSMFWCWINQRSRGEKSRISPILFSYILATACDVWYASKDIIVPHLFLWIWDVLESFN